MFTLKVLTIKLVVPFRASRKTFWVMKSSWGFSKFLPLVTILGNSRLASAQVAGEINRCSPIDVVNQFKL